MKIDVNAVLRSARTLSITTAMIITTIWLVACGGSSQTMSTASSSAALGKSSHVFVVVEENKSFSDVIGSPSMPFLNGLGQQYAIGANYFGDAQNSLPNYFMLTTGQIITTDNGFSGVVPDDNVVRELMRAGRTWKAYADSLPARGYIGASVGPYVKWHNPFAYLSDVVNDPTQQANIVPIAQLATDLANGTLPDYAFIVPNNFDNSHDCPGGGNSCSMAQTLANSDGWLQAHVGPILNSTEFQQGGLLVITYDESDPTDMQNGGGHIPLVIAGPQIKHGYVSNTFFQHASVLRLTLETLGITNFPGAADTAPDLGEFFQ